MNNTAATLTLAPVTRTNRLTGELLADAYAVFTDAAGQVLAEGAIDYTRAEVADFAARRGYDLDAVTVRVCHHPGGHDKDADAENCAHLLAA